MTGIDEEYISMVDAEAAIGDGTDRDRGTPIQAVAAALHGNLTNLQNLLVAAPFRRVHYPTLRRPRTPR